MLDYNPYLEKALSLAKATFTQGNNPIGVVITDVDGNILAEGANHTKTNMDMTAHAEITALRAGGKRLLAKYNPEPTYLFTTLEPCVACGFLISQTNIRTVVWAYTDPYKGGMNFLKQSQRLAQNAGDIVLISEPVADLRDQSRQLMCDYYTLKGDLETAKLFS